MQSVVLALLIQALLGFDFGDIEGQFTRRAVTNRIEKHLLLLQLADRRHGHDRRVPVQEVKLLLQRVQRVDLALLTARADVLLEVLVVGDFLILLRNISRGRLLIHALPHLLISVAYWRHDPRIDQFVLHSRVCFRCATYRLLHDIILRRSS